MAKRIFVCLLLTALALLSCVREAPTSTREGEISITAGFEGFSPAEASTKTYLSGNVIRWTTGAIVSI